MIIGIENLTEEQKILMFRTNELHTKCVGNDYKDGMKIVKVWIDENNCVCVRLKNSQWYHYNAKGEWY
ncbi:hypothetical protein J2Z35_002311 [Acetoanaerobium pronyense]|uniref:Uncharacterized protein n=1 Tax=Acetoanaerobium pronyense TaxID=1482736 RepID=A0ABS4KMW4_9FIRM|nr:hypothetical protein [Acetoanaerobium pronyense]MBP2028486.1 hypothetical protein [Acetoanaerobium pronyense]